MVVVSIFIMVDVSVNKNKNIRIVLNQEILIVIRLLPFAKRYKLENSSNNTVF